MFLSDPPASDLAGALYDAWRVAFTAVNAALGAEPDAQLAEAAPEAVRAAVSNGRPPAAVPPV